jgi:5-methylcytosine-specific restriction protein A
MPRAAPTPCRYPGCGAVLTNPGYCVTHRSATHRDYGRARRAFDAEVGFYQSSRWRAARAAFLRINPLCVACYSLGSLVAARVVDHVLPIKRGGERFDASNLQALCVSCHNRKSQADRNDDP